MSYSIDIYRRGNITWKIKSTNSNRSTDYIDFVQKIMKSHQVDRLGSKNQVYIGIIIIRLHDLIQKKRRKMLIKLSTNICMLCSNISKKIFSNMCVYICMKIGSIHNFHFYQKYHQLIMELALDYEHITQFVSHTKIVSVGG